jgi:hypothetical protein
MSNRGVQTGCDGVRQGRERVRKTEGWGGQGQGLKLRTINPNPLPLHPHISGPTGKQKLIPELLTPTPLSP